MKQRGVLLLEVLLSLFLFSIIILSCMKQMWVVSYRLRELEYQLEAFQLLQNAQVWYWSGRNHFTSLLNTSKLPKPTLTVENSNHQFIALKLNWQEPTKKHFNEIVAHAFR